VYFGKYLVPYQNLRKGKPEKKVDDKFLPKKDLPVDELLR